MSYNFEKDTGTNVCFNEDVISHKWLDGNFKSELSVVAALYGCMNRFRLGFYIYKCRYCFMYILF